MRTSRLARGLGAVAGVLGGLCILAELCFLFPHILVYADARPFYAAHISVFRSVLLVSILMTFALGCASVLLRGGALGIMGLVSGVIALLLGGPQAKAITVEAAGLTVGLDYFILSLLVTALLFVPLERRSPLRKQRVLRRGWQTDLAYFAVNHGGVQVLAFLSIVPVQMFLGWVVDTPLQHAVAAQPRLIQFVEIFIAVELASYWSHRAFHRVPFLWRFHAVHHSVERMDWLAGSRLHLVDVVITRMAGFVPVFLLGFTPAVVYAYLIIVSFHAVYIHANVSHKWPRLRRFVTTPEFHHWHHAAEPEAVDKNFAVLLSCFDWLFGTAYLPDRWPRQYGIIGEQPPRTFFGQFTFPFRRA